MCTSWIGIPVNMHVGVLHSWVMELSHVRVRRQSFQPHLCGKAAMAQVTTGSGCRLRSNPHTGICFGAIMGLLEWEDFKMPVCGVLMCMSLTDADGLQKQLLLLVEPGGHPRRWGTFVIKRLRKCEFQECYRMRVVVVESPVFGDDVQLRDMVRKILEFLPLRSLRLNDVCHGKLADVCRPASRWSAAAARGARASG